MEDEAQLELQILDLVNEGETDILQINDFRLEINDFDIDEAELLSFKENYCYICMREFKSIGESSNHDAITHKNSIKVSYKCNLCNKLLKTYSENLYHEVQCKITERKKQNTCFNSPKSNREKEKDKEILPKRIAKNKSLQVFDPKIKVDFLDLMELRKHRNTCPKIKVDFLDLIELRKCSTCDIIFKDRKELQNHKKIKHRTPTEKYICEVCGQVCSTTTIKNHLRIHYNYKELKCPECEYGATDIHSLKVHIRRKHTDERPYACKECPYRSATSSNLAAHRRTHTGDKNYVCQLCSKGYSYKQSLEDHIINIHEGKKRFRCDVCTGQYYSFEALKKHLFAKHGKRVRKVGNRFVEIEPDGDKETG